MLPTRALVWPVVLRPFDTGDAAIVQRLAGERAVADTTAIIPHPYRDGMAEAWIAGHDAERSAGTQYIYAIARAEDDQLVGAIALRPIATAQENLGYWIGREFWGRGYAPSSRSRSPALIASSLPLRICRAMWLPVGFSRNAGWMSCAGCFASIAASRRNSACAALPAMRGNGSRTKTDV